jgi:hypothetical protein
MRSPGALAILTTSWIHAISPRMTLKLLAEFIVLVFALWVFGAEFVRDIKFYLGNGFDLNEQRHSSFYDGYLVKVGSSSTARSRLFFWYPVMLILCIMMTLDILGVT